MNDSSGSSEIGGSGFNSLPEEKYYDKYSYSDNDNLFQRGHLGDGTKEFGPFYQVVFGTQTRRVSGWNADDAFFVLNNSPWFMRSGESGHGSGAGMATFGNTNGYANPTVSFRITLTP